MEQWEGLLIGMIVATLLMFTILKPEDYEQNLFNKVIFVTSVVFLIATEILKLIFW